MPFPYSCEAEFSDAIADYLELGGWAVRREAYAKQGQGWVDVLATRGFKTLVIEAKLKAKHFKAASDQIDRYRLDFPKAVFYFATPEPITPEIKRWLSQENILCFPSERIHEQSIKISRQFIYSEYGLVERFDIDFQPGRRQKRYALSRKSDFVEELLEKFRFP